jgi:penicillin-binding protein 1C
VRRLAFAAAGTGAGLLVAAMTVGLVWPAPMPAKTAWGTEVRDRTGALLALAPAPGGVWRFAVSPAQVSPFLTQLLIAVEDRRFAEEPGVDPRAVLRAGWQWLRAGHVVSGGSTLTMQVARLLDPRPRGLPAKAIEASRALALWSRFDRPRILGLWLSLAPFGGNLVGVEAASWAYFGKPPGALDAAEAALLVALPRRPEALRPDRHPLAARRIRDRILVLAEARGLLTPEETAAALAEPVPTKRLPIPRAVPQFYASVRHPPVLMTTLDAETQAALTGLARATLAGLPPKVSLAVMIADLPTGNLRAVWAGDWGDAARAGSVDLTRAERSPGSTLKPFLYGLAFSQGLAGPDTILADVPAAAGQPLLLPRGAAPSLPIVLGGAGQTMRGMMALYTGLATNGVVDGRRLLTPEAAKTVSMVLTRAFPGGEQQGIAWKTGTSWGDRDNWAFGFDRDHVVGVWVGRPDGTAMDGGAAVDHALPILAQVFGLLPPAPLAMPASSTRMLSLAVVPDADPLRLLFPPPGAVIDGGGAIDLKAMGGTRPLRFLVDGAPLPSIAALRDTAWTPPGPGFYRLSVLDAAGEVASAAIRVRDGS